jgi:hypothetical protein
MNTERKLKDIPALVETLRVEKARQKDYLVPSAAIELMVTGGGSGKDKPGLLFPGQDEAVNLEIMEQAHQQISGKLDIPMRYYRRMLDGGPHDIELLALNVNHWLFQAKHKKRFIRTIDGKVRAFLGSRYRPISHLDLVTTAVQVVTGLEADGHEQPWAKGARCFSWALSPTNLDVEFVQPCIQVDLNALDKGVITRDPADFFIPDSPNHGWLRAQGGGMLFPTVRIRNSETGHGGLTVEAGLYEAICDNTAHLGVSLAQVHVGRELTEAEVWSPDTHRRINEVIFAKTRDVVRAAFNPESLLKWARAFKGLEDISVVDVREAASQVIEITGLAEGVRDDILEAYRTMTQARGNLFDFQRAITGAAHAHRENDYDTATKLEDFGGKLIASGGGALAIK